MKFNYQKKNSRWVSILPVPLLFEFGVLPKHSQAIVLSKPIIGMLTQLWNVFMNAEWTKCPSWVFTGRNVGWRVRTVCKIKVGLLLISCQIFSLLFCFISIWIHGWTEDISPVARETDSFNSSFTHIMLKQMDCENRAEK